MTQHNSQWKTEARANGNNRMLEY